MKKLTFNTRGGSGCGGGGGDCGREVRPWENFFLSLSFLPFLLVDSNHEDEDDNDDVMMKMMISMFHSSKTSKETFSCYWNFFCSVSKFTTSVVFFYLPLA